MFCQSKRFEFYTKYLPYFVIFIVKKGKDIRIYTYTPKT